MTIGGADVSELDKILDELDEFGELGLIAPTDTYERGQELTKDFGEDEYDLLDAWDQLREAAPRLAGYLEREDTPVTAIKWDKSLGPGVAGAVPRGGGVIHLNPTFLRSQDPRETVVTLAHEGFHRAVDIVYGAGGTLQEESIAFGLGFTAGMRSGYRSKGSDFAESIRPTNYKRFVRDVNVVGGSLIRSPHYRGAPLADMGSNLALSNLYGLARWLWPVRYW